MQNEAGEYVDLYIPRWVTRRSCLYSSYKGNFKKGTFNLSLSRSVANTGCCDI